MDEENWVRRAQAGDHDAYAELVRRHQRAAVRVAAAIAGPDRASDATQDAFVRAFRALHRFDPHRPFRPWLLRIVANAAKNEVRSSRRHLRLTERARADPVDRSATDRDPVVRSEERAQLIAALSRLSAADRLILALRWFEELSEADMAEVLDLRPGTVKSRLHRSMTRLRAELVREVDDDD